MRFPLKHLKVSYLWPFRKAQAPLALLTLIVALRFGSLPEIIDWTIIVLVLLAAFVAAFELMTRKHWLIRAGVIFGGCAYILFLSEYPHLYQSDNGQLFFLWIALHVVCLILPAVVIGLIQLLMLVKRKLWRIKFDWRNFFGYGIVAKFRDKDIAN